MKKVSTSFLFSSAIIIASSSNILQFFQASLNTPASQEKYTCNLSLSLNFSRDHRHLQERKQYPKGKKQFKGEFVDFSRNFQNPDIWQKLKQKLPEWLGYNPRFNTLTKVDSSVEKFIKLLKSIEKSFERFVSIRFLPKYTWIYRKGFFDVLDQNIEIVREFSDWDEFLNNLHPLLHICISSKFPEQHEYMQMIIGHFDLDELLLMNMTSYKSLIEYVYDYHPLLFLDYFPVFVEYHFGIKLRPSSSEYSLFSIFFEKYKPVHYHWGCILTSESFEEYSRCHQIYNVIVQTTFSEDLTFEALNVDKFGDLKAVRPLITNLYPNDDLPIVKLSPSNQDTHRIQTRIFSSILHRLYMSKDRLMNHLKEIYIFSHFTRVDKYQPLTGFRLQLRDEFRDFPEFDFDEEECASIADCIESISCQDIYIFQRFPRVFSEIQGFLEYPFILSATRMFELLFEWSDDCAQNLELSKKCQKITEIFPVTDYVNFCLDAQNMFSQLCDENRIA